MNKNTIHKKAIQEVMKMALTFKQIEKEAYKNLKIKNLKKKART